MARVRKSSETSLARFRLSLGLGQEEFSDKLGLSRTAYSNYEHGIRKVPEKVMERLAQYGYKADVGLPLAVASLPDARIVYIGSVSASSKADWTDPFESDDWVDVPSVMVEKNRFAAKIASDSMMPLLEPGDICVFQATDIAKIGRVVLFRAADNRLTVKKLAHDGKKYVLEPLNRAYEVEDADGRATGYLVGIYRKYGDDVMMRYSPSGIIDLG